MTPPQLYNLQPQSPRHFGAMGGTGTLSLAPSRPAAVHNSLQDAVDGFRAILTDEQRQKLKSTNDVPGANDVLVFTAGLDSINRQRRGKSTASRLHSILSSVGGFCTTLTKGKPCNIADTYVSSNPEIAALVWGSVKLAMTVSTGFGLNRMTHTDGNHAGSCELHVVL